MPFRFKYFRVDDTHCAMKVGTDGVLLGAWAPVPVCLSDTIVPRVLDLGTGSGLIALMLAQRCPVADITGLDIDRQAALQARANFDASPWPDRLHAYWADARQFESPEGFDLVVCNPPFFTAGLAAPDNQRPASRQRTIARHADTLPLLDLFSSAHRLLRPGGHFCLILPYELGRRDTVLETDSFRLMHLTRVYSRIGELKRLLLDYQLSDDSPAAPTLEDELQLQGDGPKGRSKAYEALTRDFYLDLVD